jgi:hypothetical protein
MSLWWDDQRNTTTSIGFGIVTIRWPDITAIAAQVAKNDLTTRYTGTEIFQKSRRFSKSNTYQFLSNREIWGVTHQYLCIVASLVTRSHISISTQMSFSHAYQWNTATFTDDDIVTMRWPLFRTAAAQVAKNDLTSRCAQNHWRGYFSKVISFFKVKSSSVLVQQGDLGGNVSVESYFSKFGNSISYPHF